MTADERSEGPYLPYRRTLLSSDEVRELSRLDGSRAVRDAVLDWAGIVLAWLAVALHPTLWVVALAIPVIGTRRYAQQVLAHDGIHRRLLPDAKANDRFTDWVLLGPVGSVTRIAGRNHLQHHRTLGSRDDPDFYKYSSDNKRTFPAVLLYLVGFAGLGPVLRNVLRFGAPAAEAVAAAPEHRPRDLAIIVGWQAGLFALLTLSIGWWAYPALWALPTYVFQYCADSARQWLEHAYPRPDGQVAGQVEARRLITYTSTPLERLFFAPHHMNLHVAHHLWPSIPYYNLPEAEARIRTRVADDGIEWRPSYLGAIRAHLRALPMQDEG